MIVVLGSGCSVVDSVSGYEGPPVTGHGGGSGGSKPEGGSGTGGSGGTGATLSCEVASDCEDKNPCTLDSCFGGLCRNDPNPAGSCDDGNVCNGAETCGPDGKCAGGKPLDKNDGNDCTVDSCDPVTGVKHESISYPDVKACAGAACPAGFYVDAWLACDTDCGGPNNCGFCINGALCKKLCLPEHSVCCGDPVNCPTACPSGYAPGAVVDRDGCLGPLVVQPWAKAKKSSGHDFFDADFHRVATAPGVAAKLPSTTKRRRACGTVPIPTPKRAHATPGRSSSSSLSARRAPPAQ